MMLKTKGLSLVVPAMLLGAIPASGQITAPREAAQIELGPVSLYPGLQIVDAGVDDNVFNDGTAPQRDYTLTVASRVLSVIRLGGNELMFQTGNDYVWFRESASERSSNAQYSVRFNLSASRFKPFIGAERVRTRMRPGPEIDARARRIDRNAVAGLGFDLTPRTSLRASVKFDDSTFEKGETFRGVALDEALNRTGRGAETGVRYSVTPLTTLSVLAGYEEQTFDGTHLRDLKRYTLGPTVEFSPEAAIRGRASLVYEMFEPNNPELGRRTGVAYQAQINWALYGRTAFDLGAGRNISYSYLDTDPYYQLTNVRLQVTQPLAGRLDLFGSGSFDRMAYRWTLAGGVADTASARVDNVTGYSGGFGIHLGRGFLLRLGLEKTQRRSPTDPLQNYRRTRILSTVTIGS
ncbi:MAG TPA: outer membrane beta-barrel protein [Vicinamibacterales bacterium]|nr:outer membrane beta-barrel protein [Vicinamibacterales bacterium]